MTAKDSTEYHKIRTVFLRDPDTKFRTLLEGRYALPEFEYLKDNLWLLTEKVDGTNIRVMYKDRQILFGGKTNNAQIPSHLTNVLSALFLTTAARERIDGVFGDATVCLYGEGYGAKIQKGGGNYRQDRGFVLFDVRIGRWWLKWSDVLDVGRKLGLDVVPCRGVTTLPGMVEMVRRGFTSRWGDFRGEGIVARPETDLFARSGERIVTKLKCKDFG